MYASVFHSLSTLGGFMRKLVIFIIALMALFNLLRAFATHTHHTMTAQTLTELENP